MDLCLIFPNCWNQFSLVCTHLDSTEFIFNPSPTSPLSPFVYLWTIKLSDSCSFFAIFDSGLLWHHHLYCRLISSPRCQEAAMVDVMTPRIPLNGDWQRWLMMISSTAIVWRLTTHDDKEILFVAERICVLHVTFVLFWHPCPIRILTLTHLATTFDFYSKQSAFPAAGNHKPHQLLSV